MKKGPTDGANRRRCAGKLYKVAFIFLLAEKGSPGSVWLSRKNTKPLQEGLGMDRRVIQKTALIEIKYKGKKYVR